MERRNMAAMAIGVAVLITGCSTPFADHLTRIDWGGPPAAGTMAISQPKMYRRESLIDEQRADVAMLNTLLSSSTSLSFAPEIVRDTQQITAFAAAFGLQFDPASAVEYRRDAASGELRHEFDLLKLQLQLEQLMRDAELIREKLPTQTTPVNTLDAPAQAQGGAQTSKPAGQESTKAPASGFAELSAAVEKLHAELAKRLSEMTSKPDAPKLAANPGDLLRDQLAYRGQIKAALASANLDDLHDAGGSALIRLDFQAMVLPDRARSRIPGVIQMQIENPVLTDEEWRTLYRGWLDHINLKINRSTGSGWESDPELVNLVNAGMFTLAHYYYPLQPLNTAQTGALEFACNGIAPESAARNKACGRLVIAVPQFVGTVQEGAIKPFDDYLAMLDRAPDKSAQAEQTEQTELHRSIFDLGQAVVRDCGLPQHPNTVQATEAFLLSRGIAQAQIYITAGDESVRAERAARAMLAHDRSRPVPRPLASASAAQRIERARMLLRTFEAAAYRGCEPGRLAAFRDSFPKIYVPVEFKTLLERDPRVTVYEVGPREQAQHVSSVARVANSLSMALSLAAAAPGVGRNANAAASYSRQAIGRAETFERVPALIGYAAGDQRFGWVVTPKAIFESQGEVALEQVARTLDLSVSLSIPGWWPRLSIRPTTGWGLDAAAIARGTGAMSPQAEIKVPMAPNYADHEEITARIGRGAGPSVRRIALDDRTLAGQAVAACHPTSLYIGGTNVWRATTVAVGSRKLDGTAITVAPDMSGVLLAVPALGGFVAETSSPGEELPFSVFTRYGHASGTVAYLRAPSGSCPAADKADTAAQPASIASTSKAAEVNK